MDIIATQYTKNIQRCLAREDLQSVPNAGKRATDAKRGKTCNRCQKRVNQTSSALRMMYYSVMTQANSEKEIPSATRFMGQTFVFTALFLR